MTPFLLLAACHLGLQPLLPGAGLVVDGGADTAQQAGEPGARGDTGDPVSDQGPACGLLEVAWVPPAPAASTWLLGELVDAGGEQVLVWGELDAASGLDPVSADWEVCGLAFRGVGAADLDGDGAHDTWSSEVDGDGCALVGEVTCTFDGQDFPPVLERREDGCSTWCLPEGWGA